MSTLKVDYIKNRVGSGAVELSEGATIPTGKNLTVGGNLTVQGTTTTICGKNAIDCRRNFKTRRKAKKA